MIIDLLEGIHLVASLEAISLGTQAGIHPWIIYDIVSNAAGNSWLVSYNCSVVSFPGIWKNVLYVLFFFLKLLASTSGEQAT